MHALWQRMSSNQFGPGAAQSRRVCEGLAGAVVFAVLAGCTVLGSDTVESVLSSGERPSGIAYALPRNVMDFTLSVDAENARFSVSPSAPRAIADEAHRYYLHYHPRINYDDEINVTVTGQGFLKTITANTTDQTGQIILNLIKSVNAFGLPFEAASLPDSDKQLLRLTVDPTNRADIDRVVTAFNLSVRTYAKNFAADCGGGITRNKSIRPPADSVQEERFSHFEKRFSDVHKKSLCVAYSELVSDLKSGAGHVSIDVDPLRPSVAEASYVAPDCSAGVCYRPPAPFSITIRVGDSVSKGTLLLMNQSPLVAIDIQRGFFINKVQSLEFNPQDGSLQTVKVEKQSELLALSAFPVAVVGAVAESLRLRVKVIDQQIAHADATRELLEAKADLEKQRVLFENAEYQVAGTRNTVRSFSAVPNAPPPLTSGLQSAPSDSFLSSQTPIGEP